MKSLTVIGKANELMEEHGKEHAIKYFQDKIDKMGEPTSFADVCQKSGWTVAIKHIKGEISNDKNDDE